VVSYAKDADAYWIGRYTQDSMIAAFSPPRDRKRKTHCSSLKDREDYVLETSCRRQKHTLVVEGKSTLFKLSKRI
jgi:hypothetical protein